MFKTKRNKKKDIVSSMLRKSPSYYKWRKDVLKTKGNVCAICGAKKRLHVHHKLPVSQILSKYFKPIKRKYINFNETLNDLENIPELWDINNGEVLCYACHCLEHPDNINMLFIK